MNIYSCVYKVNIDKGTLPDGKNYAYASNQAFNIGDTVCVESASKPGSLSFLTIVGKGDIPEGFTEETLKVIKGKVTIEFEDRKGEL